MLRAIPRYGARIPPNMEGIVRECEERNELVKGPHIAQFENAFAAMLGADEAIATSYGRMAFYYIVKAFGFAPGSEIILPALTFWVIPELARVAGLKPVFADVDPRTFTMSVTSLERAITARTCAIVPTHLYGLPCDMDAILRLAERHHLAVIEDCAHAIGARYRGRMVGTLGDVALFSFQTLKPLNTFRGGMAIVRDGALRGKVRSLAESEPWPDEWEVIERLRLARIERTFMQPGAFTFSGFPVLWLSSFLNARPDVYLWERIRPLDVLPPSYTQRYSNVQAAIGLAGLRKLDEWTARTRHHASILGRALEGLVQQPFVPAESEHVYYQYCLYVPDRDRFVRESIRRGLDVETLHMDVCTRVELFKEYWRDAPGADKASQAVQLPVYASLSDDDIQRVAIVTRRILKGMLQDHGRSERAA